MPNAPRTRRLASLLLALAIGAAHATPAHAQDHFAGKQLRFFTMGSPGSGYDTYMRTLIPHLEKRLGAKLIPINESGAGGLVAMNQPGR